MSVRLGFGLCLVLFHISHAIARLGLEIFVTSFDIFSASQEKQQNALRGCMISSSMRFVSGFCKVRELLQSAIQIGVWK